MRDYLYLWHDPARRVLVCSGIEFGDVVRHIGATSGYVLLKHDFDDAVYDPASGFECATSDDVRGLDQRHIYRWGDVSWADYEGDSLPSLSDDSISELLFFRHKGRPLRNTAIPGLNNKFLAAGHDDGWFLKLFYVSWSDVRQLLSGLSLIDTFRDKQKLLAGDACSLFIDHAGASEELATEDIDSVLNRRLTP